MINKMEMWGELEKTDPSHTKDFNKGFKGTAVNATYVMKRLTEKFGPCGMGWRMVIEDDRMEDGHALKDGAVSKVHVVRGHLEYHLNGEWYATGPQFGQTTFVGSNKNGTFTDEEAPKKSITDCMTKCAVMIGLCADIHLGMFDDNKYVADRKAEESAPQRKTAAQAKRDGDFERLDQKIKDCQNLGELKQVWAAVYKELETLPLSFVEPLTETKDDMKALLDGAPDPKVAAANNKDAILAQLTDCLNEEAIDELTTEWAQQLGDMENDHPDMHQVVMDEIEKAKQQYAPQKRAANGSIY